VRSQADQPLDAGVGQKPMNLFSADLNTLSIVDLEDFLGINGPEEQRPSEGVKVDYKLKEPSNFPETVAAFANTGGGLVFIGVESKELKHNIPVAIPGEMFAGGDVRARLTGKIISQVTPRPDISVEFLCASRTRFGKQRCVPINDLRGLNCIAHAHFSTS
jgi:hypothetical protein